MEEFVGFNKIPRLSRPCIITEKIDGTNGQIYINENCEPFKLDDGREVPFLVGSRSRWILPETDNHGFAKWCYDNASELIKLGPGHHFGEWWGQGIQRGYGIKEKRFSLFNVIRWLKEEPISCCNIVPIIDRIEVLDTVAINNVLEKLKYHGSYAAPGFMKPEGIIVYHIAGNILFKKTIERGDVPKGRNDM